MNRKATAFVLFLIVTVFGVFANTPEFRIRFYDKEIYYTGKPIRIKVEIYNNTGESVVMKTSDEVIYNLLLKVVSPQNLPLQPSDRYLIKRNSRPLSTYRVMSLEPGEEFGFIVDLNDYVTLTAPGLYYVEGIYYPLLDLTPDNNWRSNKISLSVQPATRDPDEAMMEQMAQEEIRRVKLPPDEVVKYTLTARQNDHWMKFFLYLDLTSLMLMNDRTRRVWQNSTQEEQMAMVERYKTDLKNNVRDTDRDGQTDFDRAIIDIPVKYEILQTSYTQDKAKVVAVEYFDRITYLEIRRYTYHLVMQDNIWKIYQYEVVNQGNVGK
jgi:hypothetical protein